jgi:hypothetical protein
MKIKSDWYYTLVSEKRISNKPSCIRILKIGKEKKAEIF